MKWFQGLALLFFIICCFLVDGCKNKHKDAVEIIGEFDWEYKESTDPNEILVTVKGYSNKWGKVVVSTSSETIEYKKYSGLKHELFSGGVVIFHLLARREAEPQEYIDILLRSKDLCKIDIKNFDEGYLVEVDTEIKYQKPFIFEPGEYHLHALKNK